MLEGIEISNQVDRYVAKDWVLNILLISLIIFIISFVICVTIASIEGNKFVFSIFLIVSILSFISFITTVSFKITSCSITQYDHTEYQVTISDEVNLNEFNERYEIIEQNGKIYTIKEK